MAVKEIFGYHLRTLLHHHMLSQISAIKCANPLVSLKKCNVSYLLKKSRTLYILFAHIFLEFFMRFTIAEIFTVVDTLHQLVVFKVNFIVISDGCAIFFFFFCNVYR